MSNQVTGIVRIKVDGQLLESKEGAKLSGFNVEREEQLSAFGVAGYSEKPVAPKIECTLIHKGSTSLTALAAITDATVNFECDTGKVYVLQQAWVANSMELSANGGEVPVTFTGLRVEEQG